MRVLGRVRISHSTDESTSILRQKELIEQWAAMNGHTVIGWAEDVDVSGSVHPFKTPGLGVWLHAPKQDEWDILCAWKLDRLARRSIPLHELFGWLLDHNKTLVCVSDNIDLSTWVGRLVASVIAGVAEGELEAIRERATASRKKLREIGRFSGGTIPYGVMAAPRPGGGRRLVVNPEEQKIVLEAAQRLIAGEAGGSIATDFQRRNIPTRNGGKWRHTTIACMLTRPSILGYATHGGRIVVDADGNPVRAHEPVIPKQLWDKVQPVLQKRAVKYGGKVKHASPLQGLLVCMNCGGGMGYCGGNLGNYLCSRGCGAPQVRGTMVQSILYDLFEQELGDKQIMTRVETPVHDNQADLEDARLAYSELASFIPTAPDQDSRRALLKQLGVIGERIKLLESLAPVSGGVSWVPTGRLYRDVWDGLDVQGRRELMVRSGIKLRVRTLVKGTHAYPPVLETELVVPEGMLRALGELDN